MDRQLRILLVDDDEDEYLILKDLTSRSQNASAGFSLELAWVPTYEDALQAFAECQYDLYLIDYHLGKHTGLDLLHENAVQSCSAPIIMLTGQGNYETDLSAMQSGAMDYLEKGQLTLPVLERSIRYAIDRKDVEVYLESVLQERTENLARIQKQIQQMQALQKATSSLLKTLDISQLVGEIIEAAQEAIPAAERAWLHLIQTDSHFNKLAGMNFDHPRIQTIKAPDLQSPLFKHLYEGNLTRLAEVGGELPLLALVENEADRREIRSAITAPVILGGELLGALSLSASRPSAFSEADLNLLTSFAMTATAAIQNAILHDETLKLAATDPLTGQLNRRTFFEFGKREMDRFQRFGHPLSLLMFDLDRFKEVNDTYGHAAGDQVLMEVVERCCQVIRHVDLLGRYGGDEFAILFPETDQHVACEIAERIQNIIAESPVRIDERSIPIRISIGIAEATADNTDLESLLARADQALYQSKSAGRNRISVSPP